MNWINTEHKLPENDDTVVILSNFEYSDFEPYIAYYDIESKVWCITPLLDGSGIELGTEQVSHYAEITPKP